MIASTPDPPYYAVIFSSIKNDDDDEGYKEISDRLDELAKEQEGYLGMESARNETGITVSYWRDLDSIRKWRENAEHTVARRLGREKWYSAFKVRVALVEKEYSFEK